MRGVPTTRKPLSDQELDLLQRFAAKRKAQTISEVCDGVIPCWALFAAMSLTKSGLLLHVGKAAGEDHYAVTPAGRDALATLTVMQEA